MVMLVLVQLVGRAATPLNLTRLVPSNAPKFDPVIVIGIPIGPLVDDNDEMTGKMPTVNVTPLLD